MKLSPEQELFIIQTAAFGNNVLVDACIGSGKTTAIQYLCNSLPQKKKILYLTYNRLLKIDAQSKIKKKNVTVTNYHSFAYKQLKNEGLYCDVSDIIKLYNTVKPKIKHYDVLIIDEYQDIYQELAIMLEIIKSSNPKIQIVAVGDMKQKIYDKSTLDVSSFIDGFLGEYKKVNFTNCFRLSENIAATLGRIWEKPINGINANCKVKQMTFDEVVEFLSCQQPKDVLCLGSRIGQCAEALNCLEEQYPTIFNKSTVYASIRDEDSQNMRIREDAAIFTTYDSSKGMERNICVVFDFTEEYWASRINQPLQSYEILRNIFCVAASRGKNHIIFVTSKNESLLSEKTLSSKTRANGEIGLLAISNMFDFKYGEDVQECFDLLNVKRIKTDDSSVIKIDNNDGYIDLSPCIGIYQEANYFISYSIEESIEFELLSNKNRHYRFPYNDAVKQASLDKKILYYTYLETNQERYYTQVRIPFIKEEQREQIKKRLGIKLSPNEMVQQYCSLNFIIGNKAEKRITAIGLADVVKDDVVYELKFVSELKPEYYLQCACYMAAMNLEKGVLWNIRDNNAYEITISNKDAFLASVLKTITKRSVTQYWGMDNKSIETKEIYVSGAEKINKYNGNSEKAEAGFLRRNMNNLFCFIKRFFGANKTNSNKSSDKRFDECHIVKNQSEDNNSSIDLIPSQKEQFNTEQITIKEKEVLSPSQKEANLFSKEPELEEIIGKTLFAVIDTETNWDGETISIGIVIADTESFEVIAKRYYVIFPECQKPGMYSDKLLLSSPIVSKKCDRQSAISDICELIEFYNINSVFAYKATFDYAQLPELDFLEWFDIIKIAAYKQYNPKIPETAEIYSSGRLKRDYGVQSIYRLLSGNNNYYEKHNALYDAIDELTIMRLLARSPSDYFPFSKNKKDTLFDDSKVQVGASVLMKGKRSDKGKGIGKIVGIKEGIIIVNYEGKDYTYRRKSAFTEGWLKLID